MFGVIKEIKKGVNFVLYTSVAGYVCYLFVGCIYKMFIK